MHIPTHILSGWCVGNCFRLNARERFFCMLAASLSDLDGAGIVFGEETHWRFHHVVGHGITFAVAAAATLAFFSRRKLLTFAIYFSLVHLHLVMDYVGSGPNWPLHYLWPISDWAVRNPNSWELFSWQNLLAAIVLLGWMLWIAVHFGRSPLEIVAPRLDEKAVAWLRSLAYNSPPARKKLSLAREKDRSDHVDIANAGNDES